MPAKAELMAIHIYLISVMEDNNMHNIIIVTDSITTTSKVLESNVNPFQKIIILLATKIKSFLSKDNVTVPYDPQPQWPCKKMSSA